MARRSDPSERFLGHPLGRRPMPRELGHSFTLFCCFWGVRAASSQADTAFGENPKGEHFARSARRLREGYEGYAEQNVRETYFLRCLAPYAVSNVAIRN